MSEQSGTTKVKIAPSSKESEMMVLGCMLTSINSLNIAADALDESDFYYAEHKILFQILKAAYKSDKPADVHLVCEELKRIGKLSSVGGASYVTTLAQYAGTSAYIEEYTDIVRNKSILRRMIAASQLVEKTALDEPNDVYAALDDAQQMFFQICQSANPNTGVSIKDILLGVKSQSQQPFLKELQERQEVFQIKGPQEAGITGQPTHFVDLDKMINGLANSNLIILAARPAMGKTGLAINIAENICFKNKTPVGIFSLEMSAEQLLHRVICSQSQVESDKIKTGGLNGMEFQRIVRSVNEMQNQVMIIDDQPGLKISDLRARARRMKESHNIGLLIVDYLQLLSGSGSHRTTENRQNEISEISRLLKNTARELDIPLICLSQLSRKVEDRTGHRPMMSDLRESGCLAAETLIVDVNTHLQYTIKELAERLEQTPITIQAVDQNGQLSTASMTRVFYSGKKMTYLLKTKKGAMIRASGNHPFYKDGEWTPLETLRVGDEIALVKIAPFDEQKNVNSSETATLTTASLLVTDQIQSITEWGVEEVYDATVDELHNFVANGIVVHNSIEQDADIVMFLLRREYYDPMDKPGMAELIIAKNRHGSIGSVNLTFRKDIVQFANYSAIPQQVIYDPQAEEAFKAFTP